MNPGSEEFDPYQIFEVNRRSCVVVSVTVLCGRNITKGWVSDLADTPDPYVVLKITNSPQGKRRTLIKDNDINPVWEETFTFWLDPSLEHTLEMSLMDSNYITDELLATRTLPLTCNMLKGKKFKTTIPFNETSEVDFAISTDANPAPDLRYSLALCQMEKDFVHNRRKKVKEAMKRHFGLSAPRRNRETPVIAVIGSGGGFRAMVSYSGAMSALAELGVLDMVTYVGGLSGSSWYLSQLYSHLDWPTITPGAQREEIKNNIRHTFLWLFKSHGVSFARALWEKHGRGEPVSFTDIFGHLVGNTLIKDRLSSKLSDQRKVIDNGQCPMPLYSCLNVKRCVSANIFHEWIEFSPYEIGLPKYGTFTDVTNFACKFFMGSIVKKYPEPPLHFLQGIWGSAFCIQFRDLLQDPAKMDPQELKRKEKEGFVEGLKKQLETQEAIASADSSDDETDRDKKQNSSKSYTADERQQHLVPPESTSKQPSERKNSFWDVILDKVLDTSWFQGIELRAAQVFNFMRGLSLTRVFPFSPFTQSQEEQDENHKELFASIFDLHPTSEKKLFVVDSGLSFNSPFPLVLRPQRQVDLILSFEFSARPQDDIPPFKDLLLAAKWAELNKIPFPPVDVEAALKDGPKECYVFKHPWDPNCPIVLHFPLVNINFRTESKPGVSRVSEEEKAFGDFSIFDDPRAPYSTFKFTYTAEEFDRLAGLMEYNTLRHKDVIIDSIRTCIRRRRRFTLRRPCRKDEISRLSLPSQVLAKQLEAFINMVEEVNMREDPAQKQKPEGAEHEPGDLLDGASGLESRRISVPPDVLPERASPNIFRSRGSLKVQQHNAMKRVGAVKKRSTAEKLGERQLSKEVS